MQEPPYKKIASKYKNQTKKIRTTEDPDSDSIKFFCENSPQMQRKKKIFPLLNRQSIYIIVRSAIQ